MSHVIRRGNKSLSIHNKSIQHNTHTPRAPDAAKWMQSFLSLA